eukprot:13390460-Alexandrium_andersonii.AAC.1
MADALKQQRFQLRAATSVRESPRRQCLPQAEHAAEAAAVPRITARFTGRHHAGFKTRMVFLPVPGKWCCARSQRRR